MCRQPQAPLAPALVRHRIADPRFVRIIHRFLKAGIMEDGAVSAGEEGTPQGGLVSPVLANIYLHYVLDLWFEKRYVRSCRGKAYLVRYADDFIVCFQGWIQPIDATLARRMKAKRKRLKPKRKRRGRLAPMCMPLRYNELRGCDSGHQTTCLLRR